MAKSSTNNKQNKNGNPSVVRIVMILCSLSSLFTLLSKCVVFKDSKFELICHIPDLSGTPSREATTVGLDKATFQEEKSNVVSKETATNNAPKEPVAYKPRTLSEYSVDNSIQEKLEGLKEFIFQTSLDSTRLEAVMKPEIRQILAAFVADEFLFRPTASAIENLAINPRTRPYLINTPGLLESFVGYFQSFLTKSAEIGSAGDNQAISDVAYGSASVSKGLDALVRLSGDSNAAVVMVNVEGFVDTLVRLLSTRGADIRYKASGILGNLAAVDASRGKVLSADNIVPQLVAIIGSEDSSLETKGSAVTALSNLAISPIGQKNIGEASGGIVGIVSLLKQAEAAILTARSRIADNTEGYENIPALGANIAAAMDVQRKTASVLENLSALEANRELIASVPEALTMLCGLLTSPSNNDKDKHRSTRIVSHVAGCLANLAQVPSHRVAIAKISGSISSLIRLIATRAGDSDIEDKAGAVMGNIALEGENIPLILQAIVDLLKPELENSVKMLALNLAQTFAGLSPDHQAVLLQTPKAIESLHALHNAPQGDCAECAAKAKELLVVLHAYP